VTRRAVLAVAAAILAVGAAAMGFVAWVTRDEPVAPPAPAPAAAAPVAPLLELPKEPSARERALESNEARALLAQLRMGFESTTERTAQSEARLLRALDELFPRRTPRSAVECRSLVCRVEVEAAASEWRDRFAQDREVRRQVERIAFDPEDDRLAFVELVELRVADAPRPEGEKVLDAIARNLLASAAARKCVAEGPAPEGVEVRLMIDQSGITYRFDAGTDSKVAYCLMMEAMPDVLASFAAPAGVRRAERKVRLPPP
jgi:hypothetical protein